MNEKEKIMVDKINATDWDVLVNEIPELWGLLKELKETAYNQGKYTVKLIYLSGQLELLVKIHNLKNHEAPVSSMP